MFGDMMIVCMMVQGALNGDAIEDGKMISKQWPLFEKFATSMAPQELPVNPSDFAKKFPREAQGWGDLVAANNIMDASSALRRYVCG